MNKPTLYISCGIPGAGKSTFLKKAKREDEVLVSRDEIRYTYLKDNESYFKYEKKVFQLFVEEIGKNLQAGKNVYADATHLTKNSRNKLLNFLSIYFSNLDFDIEVIYFNVPLSTCVKRNNKRRGRERVPKEAIYSMANALEKPFKVDYIKHLWIVDENSNVSKEW